MVYHIFLWQKGDPTTGRDELELPEGWEWMEDWDMDLNRAVDEEGKHILPCVLNKPLSVVVTVVFII